MCKNFSKVVPIHVHALVRLDIVIIFNMKTNENSVAPTGNPNVKLITSYESCHIIKGVNREHIWTS